MKHLLLSTLVISTLALTPAWAEEDDHDIDHDEARARHYQVVEPKSWSEAVAIIEEKGAEMKAAYLVKDYAKMHEHSYSLEVAADYLDEESGELMKAVEDVHHATEDGEYKAVAEKFPDLEDHLNDIAGK